MRRPAERGHGNTAGSYDPTLERLRAVLLDVEVQTSPIAPARD